MIAELFKHADNGKHYGASETIFSQGDAPGRAMYVIQEGVIRTVAGRPRDYRGA